MEVWVTVKLIKKIIICFFLGWIIWPGFGVFIAPFVGFYLASKLKVDKENFSFQKYAWNQFKKNKIAYLRRQLGIIFQDFQLLSDRDIYKNLEFVLRSTGWKDKNKIKERVIEVLDTVHLEGIEKKMSHELSGGEQQRVSIARALLNHPKIILADEPTGNLDPEKSNRIIETMKEINSNGTTVVIATHDYSIIKNYPSKTYRFENKEIKEVVVS